MTAYYNEFDPKAAAWLRELIKRGLIADGVVDERSILDVSPDDLRGFTQCHFFAGIGGWSYALRLSGWPDDRSVWTGSPPCQPFSTAGAQKGKDDERHLAPHWVTLIDACAPPIIFGEQVASAAVFGKATKRVRGELKSPTAGEWAWFDDLSYRLEAAHYAIGASDIPAASVGAPHIRQRAFFGAVRLADADIAEQRVVGTGGGTMGRRGTGVTSSGYWGGCGYERLGNADGSRSQGHRGSVEQHDPQGRKIASGRCAEGGEYGRLGNAGRTASERDARSVSGAQTQEHGARVAVDGRLPVGPEHAGAGVGRLGNAGRAASEYGDRREAPGVPQEERKPVQCADVSSGCCESDDGHGIYGSDGLSDNTRRSRTPHSPWSTPDWLFCRDGKWRQVEPGTFPLAHGVSARVGRLRGYGNAIVPQVAAVFIEAFEDAKAAIK